MTSLDEQVAAGMKWLEGVLHSEITESHLQYDYRWAARSSQDLDSLSRRFIVRLNERTEELSISDSALAYAASDPEVRLDILVRLERILDALKKGSGNPLSS